MTNSLRRIGSILTLIGVLFGGSLAHAGRTDDAYRYPDWSDEYKGKLEKQYKDSPYWATAWPNFEKFMASRKFQEASKDGKIFLREDRDGGIDMVGVMNKEGEIFEFHFKTDAIGCQGGTAYIVNRAGANDVRTPVVQDANGELWPVRGVQLVRPMLINRPGSPFGNASAPSATFAMAAGRTCSGPGCGAAPAKALLNFNKANTAAAPVVQQAVRLEFVPYQPPPAKIDARNKPGEAAPSDLKQGDHYWVQEGKKTALKQVREGGKSVDVGYRAGGTDITYYHNGHGPAFAHLYNKDGKSLGAYPQFAVVRRDANGQVNLVNQDGQTRVDLARSIVEIPVGFTSAPTEKVKVLASYPQYFNYGGSLITLSRYTDLEGGTYRERWWPQQGREIVRNNPKPAVPSAPQASAPSGSSASSGQGSSSGGAAQTQPEGPALSPAQGAAQAAEGEDALAKALGDGDAAQGKRVQSFVDSHLNLMFRDRTGDTFWGNLSTYNPLRKTPTKLETVQANFNDLKPKAAYRDHVLKYVQAGGPRSEEALMLLSVAAAKEGKETQDKYLSALLETGKSSDSAARARAAENLTKWTELAAPDKPFIQSLAGSDGLWAYLEKGLTDSDPVVRAESQKTVKFMAGKLIEGAKDWKVLEAKAVSEAKAAESKAGAKPAATPVLSAGSIAEIKPLTMPQLPAVSSVRVDSKGMERYLDSLFSDPTAGESLVGGEVRAAWPKLERAQANYKSIIYRDKDMLGQYAMSELDTRRRIQAVMAMTVAAKTDGAQTRTDYLSPLLAGAHSQDASRRLRAAQNFMTWARYDAASLRGDELVEKALKSLSADADPKIKSEADRALKALGETSAVPVKPAPPLGSPADRFAAKAGVSLTAISR